MNKSLIECQQLKKSYYDGAARVDVLNGIDLTIHPGDCIAIVGPSGSGKSTLLHLLGGLDKATAGLVAVNGLQWHTLSESQRCRIRNKKLGFIYQFHHLLPEFSALENVAMPLLIAGVDAHEAKLRARDMLTHVRLENRLSHKPAQLSGGERQRVAIARAVVHQPQVVFADEPTGNLDQGTALQVFDLMLALNTQRQTALVIVTHDMALASKMQTILYLQSGKLSSN